MFGSGQRQFWHDLNHLFTLVCQINERGEIIRSSPLMQRYCGIDDLGASNFFELFEFKRPSKFEGSFAGAVRNQGKLFLGVNEKLGFAIRGQMADFSKQGLKGICFIGVPWLWWMQSNNENLTLTFDDFPVHDVQMDQLFFMNAQQVMVDDLQAINDELVAAKAEVDQLNASRTNYFRHISHEMRSPLGGIISALTLLKDGQYDNRTNELIGLVDQSAVRLLEVINFTLDTASLEAGSQAEHTEIFDLNRLIDDSLTLVRAKALEKGIELKRAGHMHFDTHYQGRVKLLRQVLSNLLSNATKFTDQGTVTLTVSIKQSAANGLDTLTFSVTDSGPGIPEQYLSQIFEPFATGITPQTQGSQGTGLGLSIVQRFIEALGGQISVTSEVGVGATFRFDVVLRQARAVISADENLRADSSAKSSLQGHVLVVENIQTNLLLNAKILETLGLTTDLAASGEMALEKLTQDGDAYDVIFMDLDMPGIDGFEAAQRIRSDYPSCKAPIIALSAHDTDEDRRKAGEAGMVHYMVKPLIREEVLHDLRAWLLVGQSKNTVYTPDTNAEPINKDTAVTDEHSDILTFKSEKIETLVKDVGLTVTQTLVSKFLSESAQRWDALQTAINGSDNATITREAHTLGSSCLTFGVENAGRLFRQIEAKSIAGETIALGELADIERPLSAGIQQLEVFLSGVA